MKRIEINDLPSRQALEAAAEFLDVALAKIKNASNLPAETQAVKAKNIEAIDYAVTYDETKRVKDAVEVLKHKLSSVRAELEAFDLAFDAWRV